MPPKPLANILDITPYKGGDPATSGDGPSYKLSANENPLGCSPKARDAFVEAGATLALYPDGGATALRHKIGGRYGIDPDRIVCGSGSDELFQLMGRAYLSPGDEIVQSAHAFLVYRLVAQQAGATTISAPETDLKADVDAMLDAVTDQTRIVFLANPNNPTGSYLSKREVARLHAGLPEDVLMVLDGAYAEYVEAADYDDGLSLATEAENVVVTRTFSKIHGLAALRLGWAYGPASVIDALHRVRGPFNVAAPAQAAGIAALEDADFVAQSRLHNAEERQRVERALSGLHNLGLTVFPSVGNFLLIRFPDEPGRNAESVDAYLRGRGLVLRGMTAYGLPDCLRLTIGETKANDAVIDAFQDFAESQTA